METSADSQAFYALGHSEHELQRLSRQGEAIGPFTRQLFEEAGINQGMRVLDVGCGSGDVAFLAANLVGHDGEVVGVDRERKAVDWARARAHSQGITNVKFVEGDPTEMEFDRQFDAIVGRLVLMYYADPVDAIRKLKRPLLPRRSTLRAFPHLDKTDTEGHWRPNIFRIGIIFGVSSCGSARAVDADGRLDWEWSAVPSVRNCGGTYPEPAPRDGENEDRQCSRSWDFHSRPTHAR